MPDFMGWTWNRIQPGEYRCGEYVIDHHGPDGWMLFHEDGYGSSQRLGYSSTMTQAKVAARPHAEEMARA